MRLAVVSIGISIKISRTETIITSVISTAEVSEFVVVVVIKITTEVLIVFFIVRILKEVTG